MKKLSHKLCFAVAVVFMLAGFASAAALRLASIFSDHMVLQQQSNVEIWGWADAGSKVTVQPGWLSAPVVTVADENGEWSATLATPAASLVPYTLSFSDDAGNAGKLCNVLIGEVWLCSGQSNMWWPVKGASGSGEALASINTNIRLFTVGKNSAAEPAADCVGAWQIAGVDSIPEFSAVAFYFGRELADNLNIPIGLIHSSWRGTTAEPWTPLEAIQSESRLSGILKRDSGQEKHMPGGLYNGMIHPVSRFAIKGVIWYQGESNRIRAREYGTLFPVLIESWRDAWGRSDLPFYFVQIAPLKIEGEKNPTGTQIPELQAAQLHALKTVPNTGMVVTTDIGDLENIHPKNKFDVGIRLSLWALAKTYGYDVLCSGPIYRDMVAEGDRARIFFHHAEGGLKTNDGQAPREFTLAGQDGVFHPASAIIDGDSIVVFSDKVAAPFFVRYCWRDDAQGNLFNNEANLPASPFETR